MPRIFVSQVVLDQWLSAGRGRLEGNLLHMASAEPCVILYIAPAVHFESVEGDGDVQGLIGTVKSVPELTQLGAEHFDTSVVLGGSAYGVRPGFVGVVVNSEGAEARLDGAQWAHVVGQLQP